MTFRKWPKITQFHNVRKNVNRHVANSGQDGKQSEFPAAAFIGKVKVDGTNAGIFIKDSKVTAQSRSRTITVNDDNYGFAKFVGGVSRRLLESIGDLNNLTIYGEWCGKGIQKRCSVSKCDRMFAVFALYMHTCGTTIRMPLAISSVLCGLEDVGVYVVPTVGKVVYIDFGSSTSVAAAVNQMCDDVAMVEECDPWIRDKFGHEGTGEGIVYHAISNTSDIPESEFVFKAKGTKHKNVKQLKPVVVDAEVSRSIEDFVDKFVTENRLCQGMTELGLQDPSTEDIGKFIKWVSKDILDESKDELESSGLAWKNVSKRVCTSARNWIYKSIDKDRGM